MGNLVGNRLLRTWPGDALKRLERHFEAVSLAKGDMLFLEGERTRYVYFPLSGKALEAHRVRCARVQPDALVFGNRSGGPFRESKMLRNVLQPAAVEAGLGKVTWHQFRHIHSSLMSDLRVPVKIAQEQLGHASISTTLNVYTHVVDASHRSAVEAVEDRLFVDLVSNGLESETALEQAVPVSDSVN